MLFFNPSSIVFDFFFAYGAKSKFGSLFDKISNWALSGFCHARLRDGGLAV